jgi:hypothetical protein
LNPHAPHPTSPLALLRTRGGGKVAAYWPYAQDRPEGEADAYSELMAASQPAVAEAVLSAFDFAGVGTLMDVGGGEGAFIEAVHRAHPGLALMLFVYLYCRWQGWGKQDGDGKGVFVAELDGDDCAVVVSCHGSGGLFTSQTLRRVSSLC